MEMTIVEMEKDKGVRHDIRNIKDNVETVVTILKGPEEADEPTGLIYQVSENTKFRDRLTRAFWIILAANAGVVIWLLTFLSSGGN